MLSVPTGETVLVISTRRCRTALNGFVTLFCGPHAEPDPETMALLIRKIGIKRTGPRARSPILPRICSARSFDVRSVAAGLPARKRTLRLKISLENQEKQPQACLARPQQIRSRHCIFTLYMEVPMHAQAEPVPFGRNLRLES